MKVSILTIGDEILNGTTIDSNSAYIGKECVARGLQIVASFSVSDSFEGIWDGLHQAQQKADIILITGGLGPTKDDITKEALAKFFQVEVVFNPAVFEKIEAYFAKRGKKQVSLNEKLAYIPANASLIDNDRGTAQGMWFEYENKLYISMPGVPHEMQHMLSQYVLPKIEAQYKLPTIVNLYIMTAGIGESAIYEKIEDIETELLKDFGLAYLPSLGSVKLRLTSIMPKRNEEKIAKLESYRKQIIARIAPHVFSFSENDNLAKVLGELLLLKGKTMASAESCTGGFISHLVTKNPGSSAYYEGSVIAYSYDIKKKLLGVQDETLIKFGAVSEETVHEMNTGLLALMGTNYGISVSGIAGPGGATPDKPVGTVWVAVGNKSKTVAKRFELTPQRDYNIKISAMIALNMLRNFILDENNQ
jgi:nicotinamide-nucleotide amidase